MDRQTVFAYRETVRFFDFEEKSFIVDLPQAALYSLGQSSAIIGAGIDGRRTVGAIVDILRRHYDVLEEEATRSVLQFLGRLRQQGLIVEVD
jgi:hypothetical protein